MSSTAPENLDFPNFNVGTIEDVFGELDENFLELLMQDECFDEHMELATSASTANSPPSVPTETADEKPTIDTGRFATVDEVGLREIMDTSLSKATERNTVWGVKIFKQWLGFRGYGREFEFLTSSELNERLRLFYAEVRNVYGQMYSKSTFVGLRAAIHRHIRASPYERSINILQDTDFHTANNICLSMVRKLKQEGIYNTKHHAAIPSRELDIIRESFDTNSPLGLLRKVWFDLTLGFARRGMENQRELVSSSFRVSTDENQYKYIEITHSEITKNHLGDRKDEVEPNKRIYATNTRFCPVYLHSKNIFCT